MKTSAFLFLLLLCTAVMAQETRKLPHFNSIVVSPHINLVLTHDESENVRLIHSGISENKINVEVNGEVLRIFLDDARVTSPRNRYNENGYRWKESIYKDVSVTAYVSYRSIKRLEVRGEQNVTIDSIPSYSKIKIKAYGETRIDIASVDTEKLKVSLYGENSLKVRGGRTQHQVYRLFGENKIDAIALESRTASTRIYGEGRIRLTASDELILNSFGEPEIVVAGNPLIHRGIIFGHTDIRRQ
jgi:Putative auto-transporter adhesin, head GIN domain